MEKDEKSNENIKIVSYISGGKKKKTQWSIQ